MAVKKAIVAVPDGAPRHAANGRASSVKRSADDACAGGIVRFGFGSDGH